MGDKTNHGQSRAGFDQKFGGTDTSNLFLEIKGNVNWRSFRNGLLACLDKDYEILRVSKLSDKKTFKISLKGVGTADSIKSKFNGVKVIIDNIQQEIKWKEVKDSNTYKFGAYLGNVSELIGEISFKNVMCALGYRDTIIKTNRRYGFFLWISFYLF